MIAGILAAAYLVAGVVVYWLGRCPADCPECQGRSGTATSIVVVLLWPVLMLAFAVDTLGGGRR